jgi:hypothetical protein
MMTIFYTGPSKPLIGTGFLHDKERLQIVVLVKKSNLLNNKYQNLEFILFHWF